MRRLLPLLALGIAAAAAAPASGAPGRVIVGVPGAPQAQLVARAALALPNGSVLVGGSTAPDRRPLFAQVRRDGSLEPGFGGSGIAQPAVPERFDPLQILQAPSGRLLVVGATEAACTCSLPELGVLALLPSGAIDGRFGTGGYAHLPGLQEPRASGTLADVQSDGRLVVAALAGSAGASKAVAARLTQDGGLDPNFGVGGVAVLPSVQSAYEVSVLASGEIEVLGSGARGAATPAATLLRLSLVGNPIARYAPPRSAAAVEPHMLAASDGSVTLAGTLPGAGIVRVQRYAPDGTPAAELNLTAARNPPQLLRLTGGAVGLYERTAGGRLRLTRLSSAGTATPMQLGIPAFGGGQLYRRGRANLAGGALDRPLVVPRPDGSFTGAGTVSLRVYGAHGKRTTLSRFGVFSLDPNLQSESSFAAGAPKVTVRVAQLSRKLTLVRRRGGVLVSITAPDASLADVRLRVAGRTVGEHSTALLSAGTAELVFVPLSTLGRRQARVHHRLTVRVEVRAADLAANLTRVSASGTLR